MNNQWHERIQRYVNGQASAGEAAALQAAMNEDAELRALYLDYMNLDVALGAAAEAVTIADYGIDDIATIPYSRTRSSTHYWSWVAASAACAAALVFALMPTHRHPAPTGPDVAAACSSAQEVIGRLSVEPTSSFPGWASPTASMLDQPRIPKWEL